MAENADTPQNKNLFKSIFTDLMPMEQRQLFGTLIFFAIILVVGWVGINEPKRMETFTAQYDGRSIERGALTFRNNCARCHGADGKGLQGVGPALNTQDMFDGTRLEEIGWAGSLYDYIYLTVAAGRPVIADEWPQAMPTWSEEYGGPMRENEVRDVVNYVMNYSKFYEEDYEGPTGGDLAATPTPAEPAFEPVGTALDVDLPEGDPAHGEALFLGNENGPDGAVLGCNACHSLDGSSGAGPTVQGLANREVPDQYDTLEQYLHASIVLPNDYIVEGFNAGVMPQDFSERLDAQSLSDLLAYLQTLE